MTGRRRLLGLASTVAAVVTGAAHGARGDEGPRAPNDAPRWSLAVDPEACDLARFAREMRLACDALATGCTVSDDAPDRRAVLRCAPDGPWTIDVYDANNQLAWSLPVDGDDRMRQAAVWLARMPAPARAPGSTAASERAPARTPGSTAASERAPAPGSRAASEPAPASAPDRAELSSGRVGVLAGGRLVTGTGFGPALGGVVQGAWIFAAPAVALEIAVAGERSLSSPSGYTEATIRAGTGISYGGPWGRLPVGTALEGGAIAGQVSAPPTYSPSSQHFLHPYLRAVVCADLGGTRPVRPYVGVSLLAQLAPVRVTSASLPVTTSPTFSASLDVGVSWLP